jgi:hypothetical protein
MVMDPNKPKTEDINCPFLKMAQPDTSNFLKFASDISKAGLQYPMAAFIASDVVVRQKGFWNFLKGEAPDLYALNQVDGISHPDKYNRYNVETEKRLKEAANEEGMVTMQDLIDLKKWIAQQEGISADKIMKSSRIETQILFVGSGGNLETGFVKVQDVLTFLSGTKPESFQELNFTTFGKAEKLAKW